MIQYKERWWYDQECTVAEITDAIEKTSSLERLKDALHKKTLVINAKSFAFGVLDFSRSCFQMDSQKFF